ncbi:hypothetical protein [Devosia submarina]|uniref:hypothetical protein n=1 Tax=Devosia submarina TaxID=1173082 RepID=UPI000D3CD089|nr:hypothetical protein [Devosia submarina]
MTFPDRTDPCWQDQQWRTETLIKLMSDYRLRAADVALITDTSPATVACWRKSVDRPITVAQLKAFIFELERSPV